MAIHVLQFFSKLDNGGAENRMMDVYRGIDPGVVMFDFAVLHEGKHYFDDEIHQNGSEKFVLPDPRAGLVRNYRTMVKFFREHSFQAVHTHVSWYGGVVLMAAKKAGIKIRIAHARGTNAPNRSWKDKIFSTIGKILIGMSATQRMAISQEAACHIFGKRVEKKNKYLYIPNAIDQKKYLVLDQKARAELRKELCITNDKKAYVTVANFRKPKNHTFLLDVAKALKDKADDFVLYLIGDGDLRSDIEKKIAELGLQNNVVLMGVRGDVPKILCAFDAMIFPSLHEGLGGVVLEAQLVGVPAVVSEAIPKVADVGLDMVEFLSLREPPSVWADRIVEKVASFSWDRETAFKAFKAAGYCIEDTAAKYLKEYGLSEDQIQKAMKK